MSFLPQLVALVVITGTMWGTAVPQAARAGGIPGPHGHGRQFLEWKDRQPSAR